MTHANTRQRCHKAADLFRAPLFPKAPGHRRYEAGKPLCPFPGGPAPPATEAMRRVGFIAGSGGITPQLTTDGAVVHAEPKSDLPLAHVDASEGVNLVSLCLGQLSVCHALLHHFGR